MSAPVIQPSNPSGGAPLAPGAGSAGANTTINPAETRVQQEAAAAQAAQQASVAYAKREKQIDDAAEERKKRVDESELRGWGARAEGAVDAPDREMIERGTTQIRSLNANTRGKTNLGDLARAEESKKFAAWDVAEQKRAYEEELSLEEAKSNYAAFMMAQREGAAQAERLAATRAQNEYIENKHKLMVDMGFKTFDELDQAVQDFKEYQASQPLFGPAPPKTIDISSMDVNAKHALMVDLGLKTFDKLDTAIKTYNDTAIKAYNAGYNSPAEMQAAERANWIAYQNLPASQQTNPILRDYAAAAEREAEYNLLGQPVGIARVPTLTNAEKYAVMNEMSGGQYLYNPLTDQISKKQQVDTSNYLTTKWYNDFVNSAPVSAIRETFGIDNWTKQIAENKAKEGVVEGDMTGRGFFYGAGENFFNLGPIALRTGNEIEHTFRNAEKFLTMPASQFLGNVGAMIYDTSQEFEKDPHRVAGNIAGSLLLGYLSGGAGIGGAIKVGSAGKTGLVRGAQSDIVGTLAKDAGLDAGLAKTAYYAGGDLVEAARKIDLNPVEAGTLRTNQLSMFQGIDTPPIERALARADTTLYGTSTNPIYDFNFRGSRDIDAGVPPQNFDTLVSDVMPIIPAERKPQLSPGEGVRGITALTPEGSARAHLLDLHPTDPATPAGRYLGVYDDLSGNPQPSLYTYPRTPESIAEYKRIRITGEPQGSIYVEPAWAAVGRKFGAVYNPRNEYSQLLTDTTIRNPRTIQYQTKIDLDSYARGFVEEGPETTRRITPRTATYRVAAAVGDVGNLINRARSARTPGDVSKKINLIPELGDTHRMKDALDLLGLGYEYSQAKVLGNVRNPVSRSMLQRRIGKDVDRLLEDPYFVSMARTGALQRYSELSPGFRDWLTERGVLKAKQTGTVQEGTAYLSGAVNPKSIVSYAPPSRQKTSGGNVPVIVGVGSASLAPKGSYVPSASPKIRSSPSITGKGGGVEIYRVPNPATYQPPKTPKTPPYEPPIPPYQPPKTPKTPPYEPPIPPYQPPKTPKTPPYTPPYTPPSTPPYTPPYNPPYNPPSTPPYTPPALRKRRKKESEQEKYRKYRKIKPQNLDHASILDPLQAINPKTKSYMTNTRTPKARGTLYEFNGIISPTPPAWATESPKKKPTKKTKTKNKPSKRKQTTHRHTQKRR